MFYFDYAATTPVEEPVIEAMVDSLRNHYGNPSSQYPYGQDAKKMVEESRSTIAHILGCKTEEFYFTSCGTESDNWAISLALHKNRRVGKHIVTTKIEHSAVLEKCKALEQQGYEVTYLSPDKNGNIEVSQIVSVLREDTALVSIMLVNNELGTIYPLKEIKQALLENHSRAILHTDAVQGFLKIPCKVNDIGADLVSISAHKIGGPKGIGGLYISSAIHPIEPLIYGGGQESGLRSGTEPVSQIVGFSKAAAIRFDHLEEKISHVQDMKTYCIQKLLSIDGMVRIGDGAAPHILCVSLPGYPSGNVVTDLGNQGICISAGSACHKGKPSHVVSALNLDKKTAAGVLRISFAPSTTKDEIDCLYNAIKNHKEQRFPML